MNTFGLLIICIQAALVQNVFSQCTSRAAVTADPSFGPYGLGAPFAYDGLAGWGGAPYGYRGGYADIAYPGAGWAGPYECGLDAYGGVGEGNVAVAGELPVAGTTAVAGQVPIMGAVRFGGDIPAAGVVSITGKCACGCGAPYEYFY